MLQWFSRIVLILFAVTAIPAVWPQQPAAASQSSETSEKKADGVEQKEVLKEERTGTSDDRLFWTLPNFLTVQNAANIPQLTAGAKFKVVARSSFDWVEFPWYAFLAGISQAENSEPGFGQGAQGYGKRFGTAIADGTIENFMTSAVLPAALRQDPRFYQLGEGTFMHRARYAISRIFVTRSDSGRSQFNTSEVFGSAASAALSTYTYHPQGDRNLANAATVWGTEVAYDALTYFTKEFWPDVRRYFVKKKQK